MRELWEAGRQANHERALKAICATQGPPEVMRLKDRLLAWFKAKN